MNIFLSICSSSLAQKLERVPKGTFQHNFHSLSHSLYASLPPPFMKLALLKKMENGGQKVST
jgi:hypothetical protein